MVAIAIGMMPMSACAENLGKVNAGTAKKELTMDDLIRAGF